MAIFSARGSVKHGSWRGESFVPSHNPAGAVYGTVMCAAVIAGASDSYDKLHDIVTATLLTLSTYWLAHAYARQLADRLHSSSASPGRGMVEYLALEFPILEASALPLIALVVAYAFGAGIDSAVWAGQAAAVALLLFWGIVAGRRANFGPLGQVRSGVAAAALGGIIIAVKVLLLH